MASLGPKGTALIHAGRRALRPTAADRERIEAALRARLGAEALTPDAHAPTAPVTPLVQRAAGHLMAKTVAATLIAGGALLLALKRPDTPHTPTSISRSSQGGMVESTSRVADVPSEPHMQADVAPVVDARPGVVSRSAHAQRSARLALEVRLLSRATSALKAGRSADALRTLDVHQRRFPSGILTEERRAAKAQALCMLERLRDGRAELARLSPQSPAAVRAKEVCDEAARANGAPSPE